MEKIADADNLRLAWLKAVRGKCDHPAVLRYRENLSDNLHKLGESLCRGDRQWGPYHMFTIHDPKEREIKVAPLEDRIAHHAIINISEPVFDSYQIFDSYACRHRKGQLKALHRAQKFSGKFEWFLKLDIHKYFDSINHTVLKNQLQRRFKDPVFLRNMNHIIDSYSSSDDCGIPIGSLTSQFFANHYLGNLDHFIKENLGCAYVRYMDDFVLWSSSRSELKAQLKDVLNFIENSLKLSINPVGLNRTSLGLSFLGMRVYPYCLRLTHRRRCRFRQNLQNDLSSSRTFRWSERELAEHIEPLLASIMKAECKNFRKRILQDFGIYP